MKSWIIGIILVVFVVAGGYFLTGGFAADNKALDEQGIGNPQASVDSPNMLPGTIDSLTTAPLADGITATSDEKISATALTCTIKDSGDYVLDLRLKNPGIETRTITIDPSGTKMVLLPKKTYRYDLHLSEEISILNILADDGTELKVQSPPCTTGGSSGSGSSGLAMQGQNPSEPIPSIPTPSKPTPIPPVPELSPLVLTLAGISGLMLLLKTRKN
jgi:hypothetical protein